MKLLYIGIQTPDMLDFLHIYEHDRVLSIQDHKCCQTEIP